MFGKLAQEIHMRPQFNGFRVKLDRSRERAAGCRIRYWQGYLEQERIVSELEFFAILSGPARCRVVAARRAALSGGAG